jgi:DNA-directed RNA polymerase subunit RPC12/RpoP
MAIRDLLYACVECGREAGLKQKDEEEVCDRCGARYFRAEGARISLVRPSGAIETRGAADWLDQLRTDLPHLGTRADPRDRVVIRVAQDNKVMRHRGIYLGRVELFGDSKTGWLSLGADHVRFDPEQGAAEVWPLECITAVQPSSTTLQIKLRHGPVVSMRFLEASPLLWEERLRNAVQTYYTSSGRGDIAEYQPRIACR